MNKEVRLDQEIKLDQEVLYQCIDCKAVVKDVKNEVKCNNCCKRILIKLRSSKGIEYVAR